MDSGVGGSKGKEMGVDESKGADRPKGKTVSSGWTALMLIEAKCSMGLILIFRFTSMTQGKKELKAGSCQNRAILLYG